MEDMSHLRVGETQGTEISKYLQEKKVNNDSASSDERTRRSPIPEQLQNFMIEEHGGKRDHRR